MNAELMLLGFISLLLTVFQARIAKICIPENLANKWLPCKTDASSSSSTTTHFQTLFTSFIPRRLLAEATTTPEEYCAKMGYLKTFSLSKFWNLTAISACIHITILAIGD